MSRFTRFSWGKIWFDDIGPCKRFDILQLWICAVHSMPGSPTCSTLFVPSVPTPFSKCFFRYGHWSSGNKKIIHCCYESFCSCWYLSSCKDGCWFWLLSSPYGEYIERDWLHFLILCRIQVSMWLPGVFTSAKIAIWYDRSHMVWL